MRVTNFAMSMRLQDALREATARRTTAMSEISSGKRLQKYSDAPTDAASVVRLGARQADWQSYMRAADDAFSWLNTQDTLLQDAASLLHRARELTVAAAQSTLSSGERESIALELEGLSNQLAGIANTTYLGASVFGGFSGTAVQNSGGAWTSTSDGGQLQRRVAPDQVVTINIDGAAAFGFASGTDVFTLLDRVASNVRTADMAALGGADLDDLKSRLTDVTNALATVGARTNEVELARDRGAAQLDTLRSNRSSLEDADLADAVMRLSQAETGYEATLAVTARLSSVSLVDFLR